MGHFSQSIVCGNDELFSAESIVLDNNEALGKLFDISKNNVKLFLLAGDVGIGKSYHLKQLENYFSQNNQEYLSLDLRDYTSANISYFETDVFKHGGILLVDNIDSYCTNSTWMPVDDVFEIIQASLDEAKISHAIISICDLSTRAIIMKKSRYAIANWRLEPLTDSQIEQVLKKENRIVNKNSACFKLLKSPYFLDGIISSDECMLLSQCDNEVDFVTQQLISLCGNCDLRNIIRSLSSIAYSIYNQKPIEMESSIELLGLLKNNFNNSIVYFLSSIHYYYFLASYYSLQFATNGNRSIATLIENKNKQKENKRSFEYVLRFLNFFITSKTRRAALLNGMLELGHLEIAAMFVLHSEDSRGKFEVAKEIVSAIEQNSSDNSKVEILAELLGKLGDARIICNVGASSYPENVPLYLTPKTSSALMVKDNLIQIGIFPVTNIEFEKFILDHGYDNPMYWKKAIEDGYVIVDKQNNTIKYANDTILNSITCQWERIYNIISEKSDYDLKRLCIEHNFSPQKCGALVYFKNLEFCVIRTAISKIYAPNKMKQPMKWKQIAYSNPSFPVIGVNFYESCAYCEWLSHRSGRIYRLLSADEWNAMAGTRNFSFGSECNNEICSTSESEYRRILPVGTFFNNSRNGIFDINGNVFEWTNTIYDNTVEGAEKMMIRYVAKGGSWLQNNERAKNQYIGQATACMRNIDIGFRICLEVNQ